MGRSATLIVIFYSVTSVLAISFMIWIALSTRRKNRATDPDLNKLGEREKTWFAIVTVLLAAMLFATIFFTPYGRSAGKNAQVVNVKAIQFAWLLPGTPVKTGTPVEFKITSADVSHGFGVYTAGGKLLFELQVLPGTTQDYVYTFKKTGTYTILCLEYCGLGHAKMQGQLTVTE